MVTKCILEHLFECTGTAAELIHDLLDTRQRVYHQALRSMTGQDTRPFFDKKREANKLRKMISVLKKQGLIKSTSMRNRMCLRITRMGKEKLKTIRRNVFLSFRKQYSPQPVREKIIFIFDIPEKKASLRRWLRFHLTMFGFTKLQKSVWIGSVRIPKDFIEDLRCLHLLPHIHILKVTKMGTLS